MKLLPHGHSVFGAPEPVFLDHGHCVCVCVCDPSQNSVSLADERRPEMSMLIACDPIGVPIGTCNRKE